MLLLVFMLGAPELAVAQAPSLSDVVETTKQAKLQEYSKSLSDTFKSTPSADSLPPKGMPGRSTESPLPVISQSLPVLRAIYGVNQLLEAEILFDGQSFSIYSDDDRVEVGQWSHGRVFHDGVLLLRSPLTVIQKQLIEGLGEKGIGRALSCSKLGLKRSNCLVLLTNKASSGVASTVTSSVPRGPSSANAPLPPLPLPR